MQKIHLLLDQSRYAEARKMLMQELASDSENAMFNAYLAFCLRMENRAAEALKPAQFAVSREPDWPFVHYVLALVLLGMERRKEALASVDRAIALDPQDASHYGLKSTILFSLNKCNEAIAAAELGLQIDPEHEQSRNILTAAKNQLGKHADVQELVNESLRIDPENAMAFANKGWSFLRQGRPAEAIRHFKEALRLDPQLEYARLGVLEALKAHNIFYRLLLAYFFKMSSLPAGVQFGILVGLYILYRFMGNISRQNPALTPILTPLLIVYIAFVYVSWVGMSLANCFLLFHPLGRLAMNAKEKRNASILGITLLIGVALVGFGLYAGMGRIVVLGAIVVLATIPLVGALNADSKRARGVATAFVIALMTFGLLGAFVSLSFFSGAGLVAVVYMWTAGQFVARN